MAGMMSSVPPVAIKAVTNTHLIAERTGNHINCLPGAWSTFPIGGVDRLRADAQHPVVEHPQHVESGGRRRSVLLVARHQAHQPGQVRVGVRTLVRPLVFLASIFASAEAQRNSPQSKITVAVAIRTRINQCIEATHVPGRLLARQLIFLPTLEGRIFVRFETLGS